MLAGIDARRPKGEGIMLTEPAPNQSFDGEPDPLDIVVLAVPESASPAQVIDLVARAATRDHATVLVVLPRRTDPERLHRRRDYSDDDDDRLDAMWRSRCIRG
jgi:hypothetical protein